jgi:hypothetical protein
MYRPVICESGLKVSLKTKQTLGNRSRRFSLSTSIFRHAKIVSHRTVFTSLGMILQARGEFVESLPRVDLCRTTWACLAAWFSWLALACRCKCQKKVLLPGGTIF